MSDAQSRLYPVRPLLAVSLAVFRGDRVLLAERARMPMANCFSLPGGLVDPGETLAEAACRETREEVGVEAQIIAFNRHLEIIEHDREGRAMRHYVIASFVGSWMAGEGTIGPETLSVLWARRDDVASLRTTPDLLPVLDGAWRMAAQASSTC